MKLDRNANGEGKYFLINVRKFRAASQEAQHDMAQAIDVLTSYGVMERGDVGSDGEFFVIKLKDINACKALHGYAKSAALTGDFELSNEVTKLAIRSGGHPNRKRPD